MVARDGAAPRLEMRPSLRRLLLGGAFAAVVVLAVVTATSVWVLVSLQRNADRDRRVQATEQRSSERLIGAVNGQVLASYRQVQAPSADHRARFDSLGQVAYDEVRQYLFLDLSLPARLQVESIRELHGELEVEAHIEFDHALSRDSDGAVAHDPAAEASRLIRFERLGAALETAITVFTELRDRERTERREAQTQVRWQLLSGVGTVVALLIVAGLVSIVRMRRYVVDPLEEVSAAAIAFGNGDLTARVARQGTLELNNVSRSFNGMAEGIQVAHQQIGRQNAELSAAMANLESAQQELVQQEKLGAIGLMLAGLAHELNNPLAGILGAAQCLRSDMAEHDDPSVRQMSAELVVPLVTEARRAGELVRNLLLFSRKSTTERDVVNVQAALDVAVGLRGSAFAQAGKRLTVEVMGNLHVQAEAQRFEHVAMNIMTNSLDALRTSGGTRLDIRAIRTDDGRVMLTFEDDGAGFKEPDRIFDAFYTTKPVGTGTGLGLTLVHGFVTEVGGTIVASNAPSGGARLTIYLQSVSAPPISPSTAEHRVAAAAAKGLLVTPRARLLVVDDEPALREVQRRLLGRLGHDVVLARDGAEAVARLSAEEFDVVITDIRMPGEMDGLAVHEWICENRPHLADRCLFITGDIAEWAVGSVIAMHPERVLAKPFEIDEYTALVTGMLANDSGMVALTSS